MLEVERGEVSGIPVFHGEAPGPFAAGLVFRVGRADERLTNAGITHLVEHLALPARRAEGVDFNGGVGSSTTWFWVSGDRGAALRLLEETMAWSPALPERLETERSILLTEAAGRGYGSIGLAAALRFGPVGHGLIGYPELGLRHLDFEDVAAWFRTCFTAAAAALWTTGEPPAELAVPLAKGTRAPAAAAAPVPDVPFPCVFPQAGAGGVSLSLLLPRSTAASVVGAVAVERARARLRYERGLSYSVDLSWEPLNAEVAHCVVLCDCQQGSEREAASLLRGVVEELAERGPSDAELAREVEDRARGMSEASSLAGYLFAAAANEIMGMPFTSPQGLLDEAREVTPGAAAAALETALAGGLLLTLDDKWRPEGRWSAYPLFSPERVSGRAHRPRDAAVRKRQQRVRMIAGGEGLTVTTAAGDPITVRFEEAEAVERWPGGTRVLWGRDGTRLLVDPLVWRRGDRLTSLIDERTPAELVVPMNPVVEHELERLEGEAKASRFRRDRLSQMRGRAAAQLEFAEVPIDAIWAVLGDEGGLLLVTPRRLVFLSRDQKLTEVPLDAISSIQLRGRRWLKRRLAVETENATYVFRWLGPRRTVPRFVARLGEALDAAGTGIVREPPSWREALPTYASLAAAPLSFFLLPPSARFPDSDVVASAVSAGNGAICAAGAWLGVVARRRATAGGESSRVANIGTLLSGIAALFWLALALAGLLSGW